MSAPTLPPRQWVDFDLALPSGASVEIDVGEDGNLRIEIECHNDRVTLALLEDSLRKAVVEVAERRGRAPS